MTSTCWTGAHDAERWKVHLLARPGDHRALCGTLTRLRIETTRLPALPGSG